MKSAADRIVFLVTFGCGCFAGGMWLGEVKASSANVPQAKVCPSVAGAKVISSAYKGGDHYCTYVPHRGLIIEQRKV